MSKGLKINLANDYDVSRAQPISDPQMGSLGPKESKQMSATDDGPTAPHGRQLAAYDEKRSNAPSCKPA